MILLADDNPQTRRMGTLYLEDMGYRVEAVANGEAAWAAIEREAPELTLVDASLPGLSGIELCRRLKSEPGRGAGPVLLLLGALSRPDPAHIALADGVLRKPLSSAGLEAWLPRGRHAALATAAQESPEALLERAVREAACG